MLPSEGGVITMSPHSRLCYFWGSPCPVTAIPERERSCLDHKSMYKNGPNQKGCYLAYFWPKPKGRLSCTLNPKPFLGVQVGTPGGLSREHELVDVHFRPYFGCLKGILKGSLKGI